MTVPHVPYLSWQYCECHGILHTKSTLLLQYFYLPSFPKCRFFFVFFVCLFFSHRSWGRSWLPYILHYLAREGAVLEKDRTWYTWSLPQKGENTRNWTEVFRGPALGALVASLWERHSNIGAKVPFQRFLCRDDAFFEHTINTPNLSNLSFPERMSKDAFIWREAVARVGLLATYPADLNDQDRFYHKNIGNSWSAVDFQWLLSRSHPMSTCWSWNLRISPSRVIWFWPRWKKNSCKSVSLSEDIRKDGTSTSLNVNFLCWSSCFWCILFFKLFLYIVFVWSSKKTGWNQLRYWCWEFFCLRYGTIRRGCPVASEYYAPCQVPANIYPPEV